MLQPAANDSFEFNLRLIDAVRKNPCLYDASDKQYRLSDHKIKIWNKLVQLLRFTGDARNLYGRWKQLRDKYGKEKKKHKYADDQSQWHYFTYLAFLDPHMVDRSAKYDNGKSDSAILINDPDFSLNLINEVRLNPCLYDVKHPEYRNSEYRNTVWSQICENLHLELSVGDVSTIYKQWKKVRDRYVREKRKLRMSGAGEHDESAWELFNEMKWIDPYLDDRLASQVRRKRDTSEFSGHDDFFMDMDEPTMTFGNNINSSVESLSNNPTIFNASPQYSSILSRGSSRPQIVSNVSVSNIRPSVGLRMNPTDPQEITILEDSTGISSHQSSTSNNCHQSVIQSALISTANVLDGDTAFAISVAADLLSLAERDRNMARAQIQHLIKNSKITILKA